MNSRLDKIKDQIDKNNPKMQIFMKNENITKKRNNSLLEHNLQEK